MGRERMVGDTYMIKELEFVGDGSDDKREPR